MNIKGFFKDKRNVATFTSILILIVILTIYIATSHSKYVVEKGLKFDLEIIESEVWNQSILTTEEELNEVANTYEEVKISSESDVIDNEENGIDNIYQTKLINNSNETEVNEDINLNTEEDIENGDTNNNDLNNSTMDNIEEREENTELVEDTENVVDEKVEETTEENIETENTITE